jgi:hypothetical protein
MYRRAIGILLLAGGALALWPPHAYAQKIPWIVLPLAASPLLALLLSAFVGVLTKSWRVGLGNAALVAGWVAWFVATSHYSTADLPIWASMVALGVHTLAMAGFVAWRALRQRGKDDAG